jgi:hypothetical protein
MKKIKCNPRNNYIIMDLLMRKFVILKVRLIRKQAGLPSLAPVLPLSYLLEEKTDYQLSRIEKPPTWFKRLDLWNFSCYDNVENPSKGMLEREEKIKQIQQELDDFSISEG